MLEVKLDKQPQDFLSKCEKEIYDRIVSKLKSLGNKPVPHDVKRVIRGCRLPTFRIRIGEYRVLYQINYEEKEVLVIKTGRRDKAYFDCMKIK